MENLITGWNFNLVAMLSRENQKTCALGLHDIQTHILNQLICSNCVLLELFSVFQLVWCGHCWCWYCGTGRSQRAHITAPFAQLHPAGEGKRTWWVHLWSEGGHLIVLGFLLIKLSYTVTVLEDTLFLSTLSGPCNYMITSLSQQQATIKHHSINFSKLYNTGSFLICYFCPLVFDQLHTRVVTTVEWSTVGSTTPQVHWRLDYVFEEQRWLMSTLRRKEYLTRDVGRSASVF